MSLPDPKFHTTSVIANIHYSNSANIFRIIYLILLVILAAYVLRFAVIRYQRYKNNGDVSPLPAMVWFGFIINEILAGLHRLHDNAGFTYHIPVVIILSILGILSLSGVIKFKIRG